MMFVMSPNLRECKLLEGLWEGRGISILRFEKKMGKLRGSILSNRYPSKRTGVGGRARFKGGQKFSIENPCFLNVALFLYGPQITVNV